jgi:hypothetical protein
MDEKAKPSKLPKKPPPQRPNPKLGDPEQKDQKRPSTREGK